MSQKAKQDVYNKKSKFDIKYSKLAQNKLFKHKENNEIIKIYIDSKKKGYYSRLKYNVNKPKSTCLSNLEKLKYLEEYFDKSFTSLTQEDIDTLQKDLDENNLYTRQLVNDENNRPISYNTKRDLLKNIKQFWKFYRVYVKETTGKELSNITNYLRLKDKPDTNPDYLTFKEFLKIIQATKNTKQKAFLCLAFETSARPQEILKVKMKHLKFDSEKNVWTIKLPKEKGISGQKIRVELDMYSDVITKYLTENQFEEEEFLFSYTYNYFRKLVYNLSKEQLNRTITPGIFRKTHTMYMLNQGLNEQYIKAHNGWSPNSNALRHYINQKGLSKPDHIKSRIKSEAHQDTETKLKLMKAQIEKQNNLLKGIEERFRKQIEQSQKINTQNEIERETLLELLKVKQQNKT